MVTVSKTIDDLGGPTAVAAALGLKWPSAASEMKRRGSIHVKHWPKLIETARKRGKRLTHDDLMKMHARKFA